MTPEVVKLEVSLTADNFDTLAGKWLEYSQVSAASVKAYDKGLKRLNEYLQAKAIVAPSRADLVAYRDFLGTKYQPTTANLYLTATKLFFSFLQVEGIISVNPAEHLKGFKLTTTHKKSALSIEMTKAVLRKFDTNTIKGLRDYALFLLMTTCGLRCIEVARANIADLEKVDKVYRLHVQGKGHTQKDSAVVVPTSVVAAIGSYLEQRGAVGSEQPLFASLSRRNNGGRLTTTSISRIIKKSLRESNLNSPRLTAHSLRHTAATTALKFGASLREVQQLLRHTKIDTTTIYLHELNALANQASTLAANAFCF